MQGVTRNRRWSAAVDGDAMSPRREWVAIVHWLVLFLRKLDCNCDAKRSLPSVRVGELEQKEICLHS
jgi:hypothetical protein